MRLPQPDSVPANQLERALRDLAAISAMPAIWNGMTPPAVMQSLSEVLSTTLDLDLAYVRIAISGGNGASEAIQGRLAGGADALLPAVRAALETIRARSAADGAAALPILIAGQPLHLHARPLGTGGDLGVLVAGSRRPGFPCEHERVLLDVAVNQAAAVLQRQIAERALERSERQFLDLADAAPAMLWVTDPHGSCTFLSRGWYAFTGQSDAEGLGFGWIDALHPEDREPARRAFILANEQRKEFSLEHRILHADGSPRWVIDAGRPRFAADGAFLGFVGSVLDITDRKRTEQILDQTQGMLSAVFEALPVGVAVANQAGELLLSNHAMHRYLPTGVLPSLDESRHTRWRATHPDGKAYQRHEFAAARALRGERVVPGIEMLYTGDDGEDIWTQVSAVPLLGSDSIQSGQVTVVTNIDAFKRTEAALRESEANQRALFDEVTRSNRNLSEFLAVLAHELRNPLAPILTGLEIMRMRSGSADTVANVRAVIERQVKQLSHLIDDLLDIARVTNGKVEIRKEQADLRTIVAGAVETSLPLIEQARHAFSLALPDAPLPVLADPTRVAQVIGNLLTNAAKYTPPGGNVALSVEPDGAEAVVTVADNGIGIPAEALEGLFSMFSQVERNMSHAQGGLGIGLSLVRQLVALHGGSVAAFSDGPGLGSRFVVRLPLDAGAASPSAAPAEAACPEPPARSLRVLVTDDNVDAANSLAALLAMYGHEVRVAHDGPQALGLARRFRPQLVFLDIGLPGMTGYEVAGRLREIDGQERSTIVAVSGWGAKEDLARSAQAGFDRHFTKPVAPALLQAFLASLDAIMPTAHRT